VEYFEIDLKLEEIDESDNRFIFSAMSITKDFVLEKDLPILAKDSIGKHVVWRHEHPLIPKYNSTHIYGRVLESYAKDGGIFSKYEVYGHTSEHLKVRDVIRKRFELADPIKISMRFRQYGEEKPIHYDVVEHSLTPTPACKECRAIEILNESDKMTEKELAKKIQELEEQLTKKDKLLEDMETKVAEVKKEVDEKILELESKNKELENKDKEVDETTKAKNVIADQLLEFNDKINEQNKVIDKLQEDNFLKGIAPLMKDLVELDGKEMESIYRDKALEAYRKKDKKIIDECLEFLKSRSKRLEGASHAVITTLERQAKDAQIHDEEMEDEATAKFRDKNAFANMSPKFFEWKKNRGEL